MEFAEWGGASSNYPEWRRTGFSGRIRTYNPPVTVAVSSIRLEQGSQFQRQISTASQK
jgi:hypothetical protein